MQAASKKVIEKLKEIIDHNGPKYLMLEPYMVYREILKSKAADRKTAGAILCVLVSNALKNIQSEDNRVLMSKMIREECGFSREMSDKLAAIFLGVYSTENKKEWRNKELKGLSQFVKEDSVYSWEGFAVWDDGNGTVDCHYKSLFFSLEIFLPHFKQSWL